MKMPSKNPEKATAYGYLIANILVLPGVGTLMAGKKAEGAIQVSIALIGVGITSAGFLMVLMTLVKSFSNIMNVLLGTPLWMMLGGILIFFIALVWSIVSIYPVILRAHENESKNC